MGFLHGSNLSKHLQPKSAKKPLLSPKAVQTTQMQQGASGSANYGLKPM